MRLDKALAVRGLCQSRTEAQKLIDDGVVTVNGLPAQKPSLVVSDSDTLAVAGNGPRWVGRGAWKLEAALTDFPIETIGRRALDVGASTGGFTECLLRRGVMSVHAVDVGHGQMAANLAADPRVFSQEGVNARTLSPQDFPHLFDLIVADLSFISLTLVLPALAPLLTLNGDMICLVKPQFEVGPGKLGKGGIVRDAPAREEALMRVALGASACGLQEWGHMTSPLTGAEGNIEFLLWLKREAQSKEAGS
jgi:23S rRNA (cytidine1920-2'-O)/16S rRNA (cytidine1409-2'-O)-methyltransferase